ncbi:response regulator [candidate division KSB1 bacterium]|nr:response regulator [candidate division KSB1 bacterium]
MRFLVAEDESTSLRVMQEFLAPYGECDIAENGTQAINMFKQSLQEERVYDLICLDIMMPEINGQQALKQIRAIEKENGMKSGEGVKVIMTTALGDQKNVIEAFYKGGALAYLVKPIKKQKLFTEMRNLGLQV